MVRDSLQNQFKSLDTMVRDSLQNQLLSLYTMVRDSLKDQLFIIHYGEIHLKTVKVIRHYGERFT
jgi:hypothetical protein